MDKKLSPQTIVLILIAVVIGFSLIFFFYYRTAEEEDIPLFEPALLDWQEEIVSDLLWSKRDAHAVFVFQDKIWLLGGLEGEEQLCLDNFCQYWDFPHKSDVWVSQDGVSWQLIADKAGWGNRRSMGVVVFQDKIWLMGGWGPQIGYQNDIWYSEDGVNWVEGTSSVPWTPREGQATVVFDNKIWLIGGVHFDERETKNDVWYSEDGINWVEATSTIPWSARYDHTVTVFQNKMWLIGGVGINSEPAKNDVWMSEDGINWQLVTNKASFPARHGHTSLVYKDKIWVISGWSTEQNKGLRDAWYSEDGYHWEKTLKDTPWLGREDHTSIVFQDEIWLMGGMDSNWQWQNDIWHSTFYTDLEPTEQTLIYPLPVSVLEELLANVSQVFKIKPVKKVAVDLSQQKMRLFENYKLVHEFSVSSGAEGTPTPAGDFKIYNKSYLIYSRTANCWLPYWAGFSADGLYGFHQLPICREGRRGSEKLGEPVSIGCVRLGVKDSKTFYNWVEVGTPIVIYGQE